MSTEATKQQSVHYGCLVIDSVTGVVNHYVEKPSSYVSTFINCGVYVSSIDIFSRIAAVFHSRDNNLIRYTVPSNLQTYFIYLIYLVLTATTLETEDIFIGNEK